jgi:uncharacterized cupredoxin-like copper-binding protein
MKSRHVLTLSLVISVITFAPIGCKSSQHAGENMKAVRTATGATVPVELDDYVIRMPESVPPGELVLQVRNVGKHEHNIEIKGSGIDAKLPENLKPGTNAELRVTLSPGTYNVTCPVGPHEMLGMRMKLTVQ